MAPDRILSRDLEVAQERSRDSDTIPPLKDPAADIRPGSNERAVVWDDGWEEHGLALATRNVRDVARTGVLRVNPFEMPGAAEL